MMRMEDEDAGKRRGWRRKINSSLIQMEVLESNISLMRMVGACAYGWDKINKKSKKGSGPAMTKHITTSRPSPPKQRVGRPRNRAMTMKSMTRHAKELLNKSRRIERRIEEKRIERSPSQYNFTIQPYLRYARATAVVLSDAAPRALDDGSLVDGVRRSNLDTGHKRYDTRSLQVLVYQFLTVYGRQYVYRTYPCLPRVLFLIQSGHF